MNAIADLDLKNLVSNAVSEIFDTMLSMTVEIDDSDRQINGDTGRIVGMVSLAGNVMGNICIHVTDAFARKMTASMLDMEPDEIEDDEEVLDVIGEVSNMIGGDIKSRLCDAGLSCNLSIPPTTRGSDFRIESKGWAQHEQIKFCNGENIALIELYIKSG